MENHAIDHIINDYRKQIRELQKENKELRDRVTQLEKDKKSFSNIITSDMKKPFLSANDWFDKK